MAIEVYDYRTDIRNILVTPQIRARFLRMEVGDATRTAEPPPGHSHDLGQEVFLVLQGKAEFIIDGEAAVLEPGEACIALVDQIHSVRNVGDEPMIMYLSVTPHIQPTHTSWTDEGTKAPAQFNTSEPYDVPRDDHTPTEDMLRRHVEAVENLARVTSSAAETHRRQLETFAEALRAGDKATARRARDAMWHELSPVFREAFDMADAWNSLTYRAAEADF